MQQPSQSEQVQLGAPQQAGTYGQPGRPGQYDQYSTHQPEKQAPMQHTAPPPSQTMHIGLGSTGEQFGSHGHTIVRGERDWTTGLCACGFGGFIKSCCCPCITYGENKQRYDALTKTGHALEPQQVDGCGTWTWAFCAVNCIAGVGFVFDLILRGDMRQRYNITGSGLNDCCTSFCCLPCSLEQQARELGHEEQILLASVGGAASGVSQQQQHTMAHQPQSAPGMQVPSKQQY